ncbi:Sporulation initiation inhibitor protein Soj [subsurface metagenome]
MRKIAILNFKGGTGKTTTAVNLSYALSLKNYEILIIDCDPQGAIGSWLGLNPENTLYNLLTDKARLEDCIYPARSKLDIIASNKYLARIEFKLTKEKEIEKAFSKRLKTLKGYDFIFLDCPPSFSILNFNALEYAEEIFLPVSMDYLALRGVKQVIDLLPKNIKLTKIIPTFYDQRTRKSKEILEDLKKFFKDKVTKPIRVNVRLSECSSFHKTIFEYDPNSRGASDYKSLAEEIIK